MSWEELNTGFSPDESCSIGQRLLQQRKFVNQDGNDMFEILRDPILELALAFIGVALTGFIYFLQRKRKW